MARDWYPIRIEERPEWHANFAFHAVATGTLYGLTVAEVTRIGVDAEAVRLVVNYAREVDAFAQGVTEHRRAVLEGAVGAPLPTMPAPPSPLVLPGATLTAVAARTRDYARRIKASAGYDKSVGQAYGIVSPAIGPKNTPEIVRAIPMSDGRIELRIKMNGYRAVAVDMRRNGGAFEQIGVSQGRSFVDSKPTLASDGTETRDYRVQGLAGNRRVGEVSSVTTAITQR